MLNVQPIEIESNAKNLLSVYRVETNNPSYHVIYVRFLA